MLRGEDLDELAGTSDVIYQPDLWWAGLKTLAMLSIVVGGLILLLFIVKRFVYKRHDVGQGRLIRMLSLYHISSKQRIALIDVAGEKLVIGITPEKITRLTTVNNSDALRHIDEGGTVGSGGGLFHKFLTSSLRGKGRSSRE